MPLAFSPPLTVDEVRQALPSVQFEESIKSGGQGAVFRVTVAGGRAGALKVYGPGTHALRVDHEVSKLSLLSSPYIVHLLSDGCLSIRGLQLRYAIMDFVEGTELAPSSPLDDGATRRLLHDVSRGVEALWALRVVHRDLKPGNIMRRPSGGFTIIDLGVAKHLDEAALTQYGVVLGTPGYMSPEQALGRRGLTFKSDLFALGVVAYQMASGRHPFGFQPTSVVPMPPLLHLVSQVDVATSALIHRMLQMDFMARPRACREIYETCGGPY